MAKLQDSFNDLTNIVVREEEKQKEIVDQVNKMEYPYKNILFKVYIQGKSLVTAASEMNYSYRDLCRKHGTALNKFEGK